MDVDNESGGGGGGGGGTVDLEQSLLQQFSCLGTTDKEELVKQLQKLLGSQLNEATASFFLDMNNWNLQDAICSYFDIDAPYCLPSMALVAEPAECDSGSVEPNTRFQKTWRVCNNGTESWPWGCVAQYSAGENLSSEHKVWVSALSPGETTEIVVEMKSPEKPGIYQSKWRMCTAHGAYFGDPMWAIITVVEEGTLALTQQLSHLSELGSPPLHPNQNPFGTSFRPPESGAQANSEEEAAPADADTQMC